VQPEVQAVEDAIDELETAVESFSTSSPGTDDDPAATALQAVRGVASSARTLLATLDDGACD
jgi:hypothetical protein